MPSEIVDCRSEYFFQNIETGIRSTVDTLVKNGFYTVSSCQGHKGFNEDRYVTVQVESGEEEYFKKIVYQVHQEYQESKMKFLVLKTPVSNPHIKDFCNPVKIMLIFGNCTKKETEISQRIFESYIESNMKISCAAENAWSLYELTGEHHTDVNTQEDKEP